MKTLNIETLTNRREFLKQTTLNRVLPVLAVYVISKNTAPLFAQSIAPDPRQEPI